MQSHERVPKARALLAWFQRDERSNPLQYFTSWPMINTQPLTFQFTDHCSFFVTREQDVCGESTNRGFIQQSIKKVQFLLPFTIRHPQRLLRSKYIFALIAGAFLIIGKITGLCSASKPIKCEISLAYMFLTAQERWCLIETLIARYCKSLF